MIFISLELMPAASPPEPAISWEPPVTDVPPLWSRNISGWSSCGTNGSPLLLAAGTKILFPHFGSFLLSQSQKFPCSAYSTSSLRAFLCLDQIIPRVSRNCCCCINFPVTALQPAATRQVCKCWRFLLEAVSMSEGEFSHDHHFYRGWWQDNIRS